jgi:hypothetical protein
MTVSDFQKENERVEELIDRIKDLTDGMGHERFSGQEVFCAIHYTELAIENAIIDCILNMPDDKRNELLKGLLPDEYIDDIRRAAKRKFMLDSLGAREERKPDDSNANNNT